MERGGGRGNLLMGQRSTATPTSSRPTSPSTEPWPMRVRGACGGGRDRLATAQVLRIECQSRSRRRGRHRCGREQAENERDGRRGRQNALGTAGVGLFGRLEGRGFRRGNSVERNRHSVSRRKYDCEESGDCVEFMLLARCEFQLKLDISHEKNARGTYLHT